MIEVKNLVKDYGGRLAVDHLDFTVEDGQIYGFLGPNGAGKSTTMNIMTGYLGATEGDVLINGYNILEEPREARKCIGYLPEMPPLYTDMTVEEYLEFAAELKEIPKGERNQAIDQVIELTRLEEVCGRLIKNLSKGYRQRVGLAQAVLGMPPVIILDEPTVGLDPKQIIEIRDMIRALGKDHTVILSSHILSEVSAVCDHVMIISRGRLVASDTPEALERRMAGKGIELAVRGEEAVIREILDGVPEISERRIQEADANGVRCVTLRLEEAEGKEGDRPDSLDVRERLFFAFAGRQCPIVSMQMITASLEDIFLELTGEDESGLDPEALEEGGGEGSEEHDGLDPEAPEERGGENPEAPEKRGGTGPEALEEQAQEEQEVTGHEGGL